MLKIYGERNIQKRIYNVYRNVYKRVQKRKEITVITIIFYSKKELLSTPKNHDNYADFHSKKSLSHYWRGGRERLLRESRERLLREVKERHLLQSHAGSGGECSGDGGQDGDHDINHDFPYAFVHNSFCFKCLTTNDSSFTRFS